MSSRSVSVALIVILALVAVTTLLLGGIGMMIYTADRDREWKLFRNDLAVEADQTSAAIALPAWNIDRDQIDKILKSLMKNRNIYGVVVRAGGKMQVRVRDARGSMNTDRPFPTDGLMVEERPITVSDEVIGTIQVAASPRFVIEELGQTRIRIISIILLLDLLLVLVIYALFWRLVLKPLKELERYAVAMSAGRRDGTDIGGTRFQGELERLRDAIEKMVGLLDARYAEMTASERKFRTLFNGTTDAIFVRGFTDRGASGNFMEVNDVACERLGYAREELLGMIPADINPMDDSETIKAAKRQLAETGSVAVEAVHRRKDGRCFPVDLNMHQIELNGQPVVLSVVRDITERKRAEEALRVSERKLDAIVQTVPDIIYRLDPEGRITFINDAVKRYGRAPEEMIGKSLLEFVHPEDREMAVYKLNERRTGERRTRSFEVRLLPKGMESRTFEVVADAVEQGSVFLVDAEGLYELGSPQTRIFIGTQGVARDITERKKAEEALKESEARFRTIFDHAGIGIALVDPQGHPFETNPALQRMLGYTGEELRTMSFTQFTHPDDAKADWDRAQDILAGRRGSYQIEKRYIHREGRPVWGWLTVSLVADAGGRPQFLVKMVEDITDRKKAEEALKESEERYRLLVERSPDGITIDIDGNLVFANEATVKMLGADGPEDLIGHPPSAFIHPDDRARFGERRRRLLSGEQSVPMTEARLIRMDGAEVEVEGTSIPITFKGQSGFQAVFRDITERNRSQEALRESEARFRTLFENAAIGIALVDPQGRPFESNPALQKMLGYSGEELHNMVFTQFTHPDDVAADWNLVQEILEGKRDSYQIEKRYIHREGRLIWGRLTVSLVAEPGGIPKFLVGMVEDITERKEAEESEALHQLILSTISDAVFITDEAGTFSFICPNVEVIFGYSFEEVRALGRISGLVGDGLFDPAELENREIIENIERTVEDKSGRSRSLLINVKRVAIKGGTVLYTCRDITDRKKAEDSLKESEERYRHLVESSPVGIAIHTDEELIYANRTVARMLGAEDAFEDLGGRPLTDFLHPDHHAEVREGMRHAREGRDIPVTEMKLVRMDGQAIDIEGKSIPFVLKGQTMFQSVFLDITERKKAEEAIRESEARYRNLIDHFPDGITVYVGGRRVYVNEAAIRMFRAKSREDLIRRPASDFVHPASLPQSEEWQRRVLEGDPTVPAEELKLVRFDGDVFDGEVKSIPVTFNRQPGFQSVIRDITERKKAEEAILESEARYRNLVEHFPDGIIIQAGGRRVYANEAMVRMFRANDLEDLLTRPVPLLHPDFEAPSAERQRRVLAGDTEVPAEELKFVRFDGEVMEAEIKSMPITFKGQPGIQSVIRDITDRKKADDALRESNALLESTFNGLRSAILVLAPNTRTVVRCNLAAGTMFGYPAEEMIGRTTEFLHVDHRMFEEFGNRQAFALERGLPSWEFQMSRRNGEVFPTEHSRSSISSGPESRRYVISVITDISERKRAEDALREAHERYRTVIRLAKGVVYQRDFVNGLYTYVGENIQDLTGYQPDEFTPEIFKGLIRETVESSRRPVNGHATGSDAGSVKMDFYHSQYRLETRDGRTIWALDSGVNTRDVGGRLISSIGILQDISDLKQSEKTLREAHERYRTVIRLAKGVVYQRDFVNNRYAFAGENIQDLTGYRSDEITPEMFRGLIREDVEFPRRPTDWSPEEPDPGSAKTKFFHAHYRLEARDGRTVWVLDSSIVTMDDEGRRVSSLGILQDISDIRRSEEERVRLTLAVEQAAESIVITTPDKIIVYANPAFERITGYSRMESIGQNIAMLHSGAHDRRFFETIRDSLDRGEPWVGHITDRQKDGALVEVEAVISPIRDEAGRLINYVEVSRDVTQERKLEEQLRQAQKMEAIGTLAGGVAHDFNNLLMIINGYANLLLRRFREDESVNRPINQILKAGERATDLTRQLLAFSRKQVLQPRVLNLNALVSDTEKMLRRLIGEDIEFVTQVMDQPLPVKVDPGQMDQVLMNLVVNARDAMPEGGRLTLETERVTLEGRAGAPSGPYALLRVSDEGVGMSEEVRSRIFEPFFTTKPQGKGTGLGLSMVYGIVTQSNGFIEVDSEVGRGTTFRVFLPVHREESEQSAQGAAREDLLRGTETILVVEDDETVRDLTVHYLSECGYRVLKAVDGAEAVQIARQQREEIHLLLTDVVMPGLSGIRLVENLKASLPGVKVIFMSGYIDDALTRYGVSAAEYPFLQKPFSITELSRKVREVLDGKQ